MFFNLFPVIEDLSQLNQELIEVGFGECFKLNCLTSFGVLFYYVRFKSLFDSSTDAASLIVALSQDLVYTKLDLTDRPRTNS